MPPRPQTSEYVSDVVAWSIIGAVLVLPFLSIWWGAVVAGHCLLGLFKLCWLASDLQARHERRLRDSRPGESICTFARGFDYRNTDTWIIRAVYEALQPEVKFPLRATDRFAKDLCMDTDDLDYLADEIATRSGRSLDDVDKNPYCGRLETVADLVAFFSHQPRVPAAA
jgi:hypothetical protein